MKAFDQKDFNHYFQVQEFRRPEFEVIAKNETEGPLFVGDHADVSVMANYFAGGGLANTEVEWSVSSTPTTFTPPNRGDYTFGKWIPWWISLKVIAAKQTPKTSPATPTRTASIDCASTLIR